MRILFLLTQDLDSPSGLGRYWPMAEALAQSGHQVCVLALHPDFENLASRDQQLAGVEVHYVAPMHVRKKGNLKTYYSPLALILLSLRATFALMIGAFKWPADIIHIGKPHPMNGIAGWVAHMIQKNRLFVDCDDYEAETNRFQGKWQLKLVKFFETWVPKRADRVTTNTRFTLNKLKDSGITADRILYLPNGVVRSRFPAPSAETLVELRRSLNLGDHPVIAYIGTLSRHSHAISLLIEAFVQVRAVVSNALLLLVGGGEDYTALQAEAQACGLQEAIRFTGRITPDQIVNYYHLGTVAVDPVIDNDIARGRSPLKLFEAWACGIPFVTADVGDRRELAGEPLAAVLAPAGNATDLARAILSVLQDPMLAQQLSDRGRERSAAFEWKHLIKDLESVYQMALQKR